MDKTAYYERLKLPDWKAFSLRCKESVNGQCQMCGTTKDHYNLELHHMSYSLLGDRREYELCIVLCDTCHSKFHEKSKAASKSLDRKYLSLHLAKTLMKAGVDVSFFLDHGERLSRSWLSKGLKIENELQKLAENWNPEDSIFDEYLFDKLKKNINLTKEEMQKLKVPHNPCPKKWNRRLLKFYEIYTTN